MTTAALTSIAETPPAPESHTPGRRRRRPGRRGSLERPLIRWVLIAPAVIMLLAVTVYPFAYALFISTHRWKTTYPVKSYIGLDNYRNLLGNDDRFINALERTALIGVSALALEFAFGFVMAVLFWRTFHRVRWLATLILLPMLISPVVVGFTARMAFTDSYGFVNQVLSLLLPGGDISLNWLSSPTLAPLVVIFADAWQWGPFMFLLLLAGLLSTSPEQIEAARVDGARDAQVFRFIVLPAMRYVIIVALVLRGLDLLRMFDVVALATRGGPGIATETLTYYIYNLAFSFFDLGYAAAAAVLMLVGVSALVGLAVRSLVRGAAA